MICAQQISADAACNLTIFVTGSCATRNDTSLLIEYKDIAWTETWNGDEMNRISNFRFCSAISSIIWRFPRNGQIGDVSITHLICYFIIILSFGKGGGAPETPILVRIPFGRYRFRYSAYFQKILFPSFPRRRWNLQLLCPDTSSTDADSNQMALADRRRPTVINWICDFHGSNTCATHPKNWTVKGSRRYIHTSESCVMC